MDAGTLLLIALAWASSACAAIGWYVERRARQDVERELDEASAALDVLAPPTRRVPVYADATRIELDEGADDSATRIIHRGEGAPS